MVMTLYHLHHHHDHHQSVLPKRRSFAASAGTKVAVLFKGRSSTANSGIKAAVLPGINRCSSFPLLSAPHFLFSIWTDLKRSEMIPGAPTWRWGEWKWLIGRSGLHRNSPQGLNISSIRGFWLEQTSGNHNHQRQVFLVLAINAKCVSEFWKEIITFINEKRLKFYREY